jgi:hypothetical protein
VEEAVLRVQRIRSDYRDFCEALGRERSASAA